MPNGSYHGVHDDGVCAAEDPRHGLAGHLSTEGDLLPDAEFRGDGQQAAGFGV